MWGITSFADEVPSTDADSVGPAGYRRGVYDVGETRHGYNGLRLVLNEINASNPTLSRRCGRPLTSPSASVTPSFQRIDEAADMTPLWTVPRSWLRRVSCVPMPTIRS